MTSGATAQRTFDELVISTKAVVSWIKQSQFPIQDKIVFFETILFGSSWQLIGGKRKSGKSVETRDL